MTPARRLLLSRFSLDAFMSPQSAGFWFDFRQGGRQFQDAAGTTPAIAVNDPVARAVSRSFAYDASQATAGQRPKVASGGGIAFDGVDDNLLTNYVAGPGANFIVASVAVPASTTANPVYLGARNVADARAHLGIDSSTGRVRYGLGSTIATIGVTDRRSSEFVVGMTWDGSTVRIYDGGAFYEAPQVGLSTTETPLAVGALSTSGTINGFWPGGIIAVAGGRQFIDLARFNQIASQL